MLSAAHTDSAGPLKCHMVMNNILTGRMIQMVAMAKAMIVVLYRVTAVYIA